MQADWDQESSDEEASSRSQEPAPRWRSARRGNSILPLLSS